MIYPHQHAPNNATPVQGSPHVVVKPSNATGNKSEHAQNSCPNSCGDCEPINAFFTSLIFPHHQTEQTVEATLLSRNGVDTIPMVSMLDKNLSFPTVCSFASTLTQSSQDPSDIKSKDEIIGRRLTAEERSSALDNCRSLRVQISNFEANFAMQHGRIPTSAADKAPFVDIYNQYREGKRCIRADAAIRIQALCRGAILRMKATKKLAEARVDELLEIADLEDTSLLTTQLIAKYLTPEERKKIATKVLSEKLYHHKDELALALPDDAKGDEYMCAICEMPKLSKKNGTILEKCDVCPVLNRSIVLKKKEEKKSNQLMQMERKKLAYEKETLQKLKQQMEEERKKLFGKGGAQKQEVNTVTPSSSALHEPLEVRAKKRLEEMRAAKARVEATSKDEKKEYGFGQESFSNIINNLRADLKNGVHVTTTNKEEAEVNNSKKKDEKDEDDDLLDDPEITHMQRKIRGCPSEHSSEAATTQGENITKHQHDEKCDVDDDVSYGGFPNKAEYDKFQENFVKFERDHADIIDFMRKKVGRRGRSAHRDRSPSVRSLSSDDSREFERRRRRKEKDHDRRRSHRDRDDYRHRRRGRRHERGQRYYDEDNDSDSLSSESSYCNYERRHHNSSRPRRHHRYTHDRYDRGYVRKGDRDYGRGDDRYEARRRDYSKHRNYMNHRRGHCQYESRYRRKHRGHDYLEGESYSSGDDCPDFDHSRRAQHIDTTKPKTFSKPLGLN